MQEKKILWFLKKSPANVLLGGLIVAFVVGLIWSYVEAQKFSYENSWLTIIEMLLLAVIVGAAVGVFAGDASKSTLWSAAGLAVVGTAFSQALAGAGMAGAKVDDAILGSMATEVFSPTVTLGAVVIGIVAAASTALASKIKM